MGWLLPRNGRNNGLYVQSWLGWNWVCIVIFIDMDSKIEYFTQKLNSLRVKEATYNSSGYGTPAHIKQEIRLTEIALNQIKNSSK